MSAVQLDIPPARAGGEGNPFFAGPRADLLSMIPFALLVGLLYLVEREAVLRPKVPR